MTLPLANTKQGSTLMPEETVLRIRAGEETLRCPFIAQYQPFIASATARLINAPAFGRDEYSVALDAFNEAIDRFDPARNRSFLSYSDLVINHRVIDYIRSNRKHDQSYPFTYFEAEGNESVVERSMAQNSTVLADNVEIREEIETFTMRLAQFGIKLADLVQCAPRHIDSRLLCTMLARKIASSQEMAGKLERTGQIPMTTLLESVQVSRRVVENNRKYIIAVYVILTGGMEIIKGYINFIQEGVGSK